MVGVLCAMALFSLGDLVEVWPGMESVVAHPVFPYIHESHDVAALALGLYVAHRMTPRIGVSAIVWFLVLHLPYLIITFPHEVPEFSRLLLMSGASLFGIRIIAIRNRLEKKLARQATLDPLTGLMNPKYFHKELERELALARRYGEQGTLLFLDLDGFKAVNDRLGHHAGDTILRRVADIIPQSLRVTDIVARLGGDEFAVFLPRTDTDQARAVAETIRKTIDGLPVGETIRISASIGLAAFPDHGESVDGLLVAADRAMYRAKAGGRNRLTIFQGERPIAGPVTRVQAA
ncbi:MAG: GGDEF domain-containing protein [Nitrospirota bacterium]